ncbi:TetR/AcrR family transcriptional regulator [Alteromonas lipolytica]|uniref:TetR family transcriptional regulator n=1 Tax=Alteromonas lipolytica TaxID=1856405 RepID=A0A1E8FH76_9ALTE|nr:TetR/AcrR family transcriptional regulator [Alteromonas lipolytica]OFI35096.1 TetR family transcriptional regulator [Alteromonas lipolytica]GGF56619.1 TetR family transcriptional regulator [Alteromonas lipolytica]
MSKQTKTRIIEAAEQLFALQGYGQTSMREITARADVNLASVNYHFGSKKNLIQALLKRYFDVMMPQIDTALETLIPSVGRRGVDQVLQSLKGPLLNLNEVQPNGTEMFVQLLGKGYTESQGHLRRFIMGNYGDTVHTILAMLRTALPAIPADELFWRLHFAIGSFVFSMASSQALKDIAKADYQQDIDIADVIEHLFPFVAKGISGDGYQNEF